MTVRSRAWGVLSLEPNVPSESTCVYSAEISVLRKAARIRCSSTPVRLESPRKLSAGNGREFLGSGSFLSTVVRSEVAGRSAGIDWRRGFDPIDRSISVDSRAVFGSLIHQRSCSIKTSSLLRILCQALRSGTALEILDTQHNEANSFAKRNFRNL